MKFNVHAMRRTAALGLLTLAAACTTTPPVPIPSKPAAPENVDIPPPRPRAPGAAAPTFQPPQQLADGTRLTLNYGLSPEQNVWHLRSAWNVAALNCLQVSYSGMAEEYGNFLNAHEADLRSINTGLDRTFRAEHGSGYARIRDTYMTRVYNYFALPPAKRYFCDAMQGVAQRHAAANPADLRAWSTTELANVEAAFDAFYDDFEQWRVNVAEWDRLYGAEYGAPYGVYPQSYSAPVTVGPTSIEQAGE